MNNSYTYARVLAIVAATAVLAIIAGCNTQGEGSSQASMETFTAGMKTYLAQKGKLCLGKTEWPVSVAPQQEQARSRDAVQMPVLQKLGLVDVTEAVVQYKDESKSELIKVKQYSLTSEGRQWYTDKPPSSVTSDGARVQHHGDLCVATLTLDKVIGWDQPHTDQQSGKPQTAVTYTYHIDPAPWTRTPDAMRVFPMVAQVIEGAGTAQLKEVFSKTDKGWVPADLG